MPLHDWSRVEPRIFHAFHASWIIEIQNSLNAGLLPDGYYALAEQHAGDYVADVLALHIPPSPEQLEPVTYSASDLSGGTAVVDAPPQVARREKIELDILEIQRRVSIRHLSSHRIVAILEIVSPGNKNNQSRFDQFVHNTVDAIQSYIIVLLIDLHATGRFDRDGIHSIIRSLLAPHLAPAIDPPRYSTLASYCPDPPRSVDMYVEHVEPEMPLPDMPIFLNPERYVNVPLEATYLEAWKGMPAFWRNVVLGNSLT
jgi:hypothetical protein